MRQNGSKLNLFYPQWQGGGPDLATFFGAHELKDYYCQGLSFAEIAVSREEQGPAGQQIYEFKQIMAQTETAGEVLNTFKPGRIFTIGGGCDAGILSAAYLNEIFRGDLALVWLDAHGDLNTPQSSPSGYLYGMPLRILLGEGEPAITKLVSQPYEASQLIMAGLRDLDQAEQEYLAQKEIRVLSVEALTAKPSLLGEAVKDQGCSNLYIHLDLDVLDPEQFPHVPAAVAGGLAVSTLSEIIDDLWANGNLCGLGIFEYSTSGRDHIKLLRQLCRIGFEL